MISSSFILQSETLTTLTAALILAHSIVQLAHSIYYLHIQNIAPFSLLPKKQNEKSIKPKTIPSVNSSSFPALMKTLWLDFDCRTSFAALKMNFKQGLLPETRVQTLGAATTCSVPAFFSAPNSAKNRRTFCQPEAVHWLVLGTCLQRKGRQIQQLKWLVTLLLPF